MRYAFSISYDGTAYWGWQAQSGGGSVQDALEAALAALGETNVRVVGAGRTDAGVHAKAMVAHATLEKGWTPRRLTLAINSQLPPDISVMASAVVPDGFHARKSALTREYRYFIRNAPTCYPHLRPYVLWLPGHHYDWSRAKSAVRLMAGEHDFRAFCRRIDCPDDTVRTVEYARLFQRGPHLMLCIVARSYLTNMIRIAVGNLLAVAAAKRDVNWFRSLLAGEDDRCASAKTAAASGLFFWRAVYRDPIDWQF